jgi:hypothetical protein
MAQNLVASARRCRASTRPGAGRCARPAARSPCRPGGTAAPGTGRWTARRPCVRPCRRASRQRGLRRAERTGRDVQPPAVEPRHRVFEAFALFAPAGSRRARAVVELHLAGRLRAPAHLVLEPAEGQPRRAVLDHRRDAFGPVLAGAHHDDIGVRIAAARDEGLGAGQLVALRSCAPPGLQRGGVRAGAGFGQAVAEHGLHRQRFGQEARLQVVRPKLSSIARTCCGSTGTPRPRRRPARAPRRPAWRRAG